MSWVHERLKQRKQTSPQKLASAQRVNPILQSPSWMDVWNNVYNIFERCISENNEEGPQFGIKRVDNNCMILINPLNGSPKPLVNATLEVEDKFTGKLKLTWTNVKSGSRSHHFQISQGLITKTGEMTGYPGYPNPPEEPMPPEAFVRYVLDPVLFSDLQT